MNFVPKEKKVKRIAFPDHNHESTINREKGSKIF